MHKLCTVRYRWSSVFGDFCFFSKDDSLLEEEEEELGSDRGSGLKLYSLSICEDSLSQLLSSVITNSAMVSISNPPNPLHSLGEHWRKRNSLRALVHMLTYISVC